MNPVVVIILLIALAFGITFIYCFTFSFLCSIRRRATKMIRLHRRNRHRMSLGLPKIYKLK